MKFLRLLIIFFAAGLVFSSCQKELSFEGGEATGTLKFDASGDCLPAIINGTYMKDTLLKASNSVDVTADIITTGTYFIKTDTINGYSFSASGNAAITGPTTIHLVGSGRPLNPGVDVFTVKFGNSTCQINIIVTIGTGSPTAVFTLGGAPATCTGAVLTGTYTQGQPATGTATLNVTVTTPGTYNITTGPVNGVTFSGSGILSVSSTTITLTASGTAGTTSPATYPVSSGTSNCSFDVTYAPAGPAGTYSINCPSATVSGVYETNAVMNATNFITVSVTTITPGTYTISTGAVNGVTFAATGTLAAGTNNIVLTASGTAGATAGTFSYPINSNPVTTVCNVSVPFTAPPPASYTIVCATPATLGGTFKPGVAMTATNTMTVSVNVGTAGAYTITSGPVNGVTFSKTGNFAATGTQNVILTATGIPAAAGGFVYNVPGTTGSCPTTVFYDGIIATLGALGTKTFNFDNAAAYDNTTIPGYTFLTLDGYNDATSFEEFFQAIGNATGVFTTGTPYTVNQGPGTVVIADYVLADNSDDYLAQSDPPTVQTQPFTITITSINATRVTGTFVGKMLDNSGAGPGSIVVTSGSFSLTF